MAIDDDLAEDLDLTFIVTDGDGNVLTDPNNLVGKPIFLHPQS
jgi:hypothetical protein